MPEKKESRSQIEAQEESTKGIRRDGNTGPCGHGKKYQDRYTFEELEVEEFQISAAAKLKLFVTNTQKTERTVVQTTQ